MNPRVLIPARIDPRPPPLGAVVHELGGRSMGTTWSVRLVAGPARACAPLQQGVQAVLDAVVSQMSHWERDSHLSRFNRAAPGTWHALPDGLRAVLAHGVEVARTSGGAFDFTAAPLVDLWGFGAHGRHAQADFPPPAQMDRALAHARCGWWRLQFDDSGARARQPGGLALDLSAIAKGFGVDQVARWLERQGVESYLVEVGGELRGHGTKPDGQPWWVALEAPPQCTITPPLVALHGFSVATSGDYRRWFRAADGRLYSHTIDPRSAMPVTHGLASVTVLHEHCVLADAWSTALTVLGPDEGLAMAETQRLAAYFIVRREHGFDEIASSALRALLA